MAKKSLAKNYFYNLIYEVLILVLPLITTPYLSRVLGAEKIGIYTYTYSIVTYFILFGSLGVAMYGQREIAYAQDNPDARKKIFFEIVIFRFITIIISTIIYAVFIYVKTKEDLVKFTLIYSIADCLGNMSLWLYLPKYLKGGKVKNINVTRHLPQIMLLFVPQIANQVYKILDTTMIGRIVADKTETGYYEQGQKVIRLLLTIVTSLGTVMIPRMANTFATGDKKKIKEYMNLSFNFVFFLGFPLTFGIVSIAKAFVPVFLGPGYDKVVTLIYMICPIILLMGVANVIGTQYLLPTKRQKEFTISITIGVIVNFILNYILISLYASIGACIATVLSQLVVDCSQFFFVRKDVDIKEVLKLTTKYLISSLVMFAVCFGVRAVLNIDSVSNLITTIVHTEKSAEFLLNSVSVLLQVLFGALTYFVMLIILKDDYVYKFINKIKEKISRKKVEEVENG